MIILYSKNINYNFLNNLNNYNNIDYIHYFECSHCNSYNLIKWGSYNRNLYYIEDNIIKYKKIKILRVKCKDCGKTHALIPAFIVPYKIHALDVILSALSNDDISLSINYDTITRWNKQFNKFIPYLKTMFSKYIKPEIINLLKQNIFKYYKQYFDVNKKILMMIRSGIYNMAPF